jgi:sugar lactone lactonase YvrE
LLSPPGGFGEVTAVAFTNGSLYVADGLGAPNPFFPQATARNVIWQFNPTSNSWSQVISGVKNPTGLAFWNGNIYVSSFTDGKVYAFSPSGQALGTVWTQPDNSASPYGLAFDAKGNLFIAGFGVSANGTRVFKVAAADVAGFTQTSSVFIDPGLQEPTSLAFDSSGNLYVSYYNALKMFRVSPDGRSIPFPMAASENAIAIDGHNNLFTVVNSGPGGQIRKLQGFVGCVAQAHDR